MSEYLGLYYICSGYWTNFGSLEHTFTESRSKFGLVNLKEYLI